MKRECTQTIKVLFPTTVFYNSDITVDIPQSGDMIRRIRLVIDVDSPNTKAEEIIREAEFLHKHTVLERLYGDFMHVDNAVKSRLEKQAKLRELLCIDSPGRVYLHLPFYVIEKGFPANTSLNQLRILFGDGDPTTPIEGYLLIDYVVSETLPVTPYFQRHRQVQKLQVTTENAQTLTLDTYFVGPVYELYFTVRKKATGEYVDAIENIKFLTNDMERFNHSGKYLRCIEPLKRHGGIPTEPVYVYSFSVDPENTDVPSGQTNFPENQRFIITFLKNLETYTFTIFAQSHNFYYVSDTSNVKPMFESTELLLSAKTTETSNFEQVPMLVSYENYANTITVSYSSDYYISNVSVYSEDLNEYTITPTQIIFSNVNTLDLVNSVTLTFSSPNFGDRTCYLLPTGSRAEIQRIQPNLEGKNPTYLDGGQKFHTVSSNSLNLQTLTNVGLVINSLSIDQYRHFNIKSQFKQSDANASITVTGIDDIITNTNIGISNMIMKYDSKYNLIYYSTIMGTVDGVYSNCIFCNTDSYFDSDAVGFYLKGNTGIPDPKGIPFNGLDPGEQGIVARISGGVPVYTKKITNIPGAYINEDISPILENVCIDSSYNIYVYGRSQTGPTSNSRGFVFGNDEPVLFPTSYAYKAFLLKLDKNGNTLFYIVFDNVSPYASSCMTLDRSENPVLLLRTTNTTLMYKNSNTVPTSTTFENNQIYLMKFTPSGDLTWITNTRNNTDEFYMETPETIIAKDFFDNIHIFGKFLSFAPTFNRSVYMKFDSSGNRVFARFWDGNEFTQFTPFLDRVNGVLFVTYASSGIVYFKDAEGGILTTLPASTNSTFLIDNLGNITTTPQPNLVEFFKTINDPYATPYYDVTYFENPFLANIFSVSASLGTFEISTNTFPVEVSWDAVNYEYANLYYHGQTSTEYIFKTQTALSSNLMLIQPDAWFSNTYSFKVLVDGFYGNTQYKETTLVVPKNPTYANIYSISSSLGAFDPTARAFPVTVSWNAEDYIYANVYSRDENEVSFTQRSNVFSPTSSNIVNIVPTIGRSNTHTLQVEVFNINNPLPLPTKQGEIAIPKFPDYATISSTTSELEAFNVANRAFPVRIRWTAEDYLFANVFSKSQTDTSNTLRSIRGSADTSNVLLITPTIGSSNLYTFRVEVANTYNLPVTDPQFSQSSLSIPKFPNYATISSITTSVGAFNVDNRAFPVTIDWDGTAQDYLFANVFSKSQTDTSNTLRSVRGSADTSNVLLVAPTIGSSNTYTFRVEVANIYNLPSDIQFASNTNTVIPKFPNYATISSIKTSVGAFNAGNRAFPVTIDWDGTAQDYLFANVFSKSQTDADYTLRSVRGSADTSNVLLVVPTIGSSNTYAFRVDVANTYNLPSDIQFASNTNTVIPKFPDYATISSTTSELEAFNVANRAFPVRIRWTAEDYLFANVFSKSQTDTSNTLRSVRGSADTSNVLLITPTIGSSNLYTFRVEVANTYNLPVTDPQFSQSSLSIPKFPNYATISSITTSVGSFDVANRAFPVTVNWTAQDYLFANVFSKSQTDTSNTLRSVRGSADTSNVLLIAPTIGSSNTYTFRVDVANTYNLPSDIQFASNTNTVIPKFPNYATISSMTTSVGSFDGTSYPVTVSWTAEDVLFSNVYYHANGTSDYTFWNTVPNTLTSNIVYVVPGNTANIYSFKVSVANTYNLEPLPFIEQLVTIPAGVRVNFYVIDVTNDANAATLNDRSYYQTSVDNSGTLYLVGKKSARLCNVYNVLNAPVGNIPATSTVTPATFLTKWTKTGTEYNSRLFVDRYNRLQDMNMCSLGSDSSVYFTGMALSTNPTTLRANIFNTSGVRVSNIPGGGLANSPTVYGVKSDVNGNIQWRVYTANAYTFWPDIAVGTKFVYMSQTLRSPQFALSNIMGNDNTVIGQLTRTYRTSNVGSLISLRKDGSFNWSLTAESSTTATSNSNYATCCSVDPNNDSVFLCGHTFGGSDLLLYKDGVLATNYSLVAGTGQQSYITKFDSSGTYQWVNAISGTSTPYKCVVDNANGVYISTQTSATGSIYNSSGSITAGVGVGAHIIKFNAGNGVYQWNVFVSSTTTVTIPSIALDPSGNIFFTITKLSGDSSFSITDASRTTTAISINSLLNYGFLCKLNSSGNLQWYTYFDGLHRSYANPTVSTNGSDTYLTFTKAYANSNLYDSTRTSANLVLINTVSYTTTSANLVCVANYDTNGLFVLPSLKTQPSNSVAYVDGPGTSDAIYGVTPDISGNVYTVGCTSNTNANANVYNSMYYSNASANTVSPNSGFLVKYNPRGLVEWTRPVSDAGISVNTGVSVDQNCNVYVSGTSGNFFSTREIFPNYGMRFRLYDTYMHKYVGLNDAGWGPVYRTATKTYATVFQAYNAGVVYNDHLGYVALSNVVDNSFMYSVDNQYMASSSFVANDPRLSWRFIPAPGQNEFYILNGYGQTFAYRTAVYPSYVLTTPPTTTLTNSIVAPFRIEPEFDNVGRMFTVKYDTTGTQLWRSNVIGPSQTFGTSVSVETSNVLVTGHTHMNRANIFTTSNVTTTTRIPGSQGFFIKYDTSGNILWSNTSNLTTMNKASSEGSNVYVVGSRKLNLFRLIETSSGKYVTFNGTNYTLTTTLSSATIFNVKDDNTVYGQSEGGVALQTYGGSNADGEYLNSGCGSSPFFENDPAYAWRFDPTETLLNSDNRDFSTYIYSWVCGYYNYSWICGYYLTTNSTTGNLELTPTPKEWTANVIGITKDARLVKYRHDGSFVWNAWTSNAEFYSTVTANGNVYAAGQTWKRASIFNSSNSRSSSTTLEDTGIMVKYNANGGFLWFATVDTDTGYASINDMTVEGVSNVIVTGRCVGANTITFRNANTNVAFTLTTPTENIGFTAKYSETGRVLWRSITSLSSLNSISTDSSNIYTGGSGGFKSSVRIYNPDNTPSQVISGPTNTGLGFITKSNFNGYT